MQRKNPKTGTPFSYGDKREDGFLFHAYNKKQIKQNGFFVELWMSPEKFDQAKIKNNKFNIEYAQTLKGRSNRLLISAKNRAKANNAIVSINKQWVEKKLSKGICELTNLPFNFALSGNKKQNAYAPSLDRIDSSNKNYTPENTRVVLCAVNLALNQFEEQKILPILEAMVKSIKDKK